ncbi:glutaredoxin family protein [Alteromonas halophila]|uniref:Glutaredoxin family protein n=1 Tax=Alteromonas halophila TaxID=516698 RepID=A0A918JN42_9ALTE|nr:glutaredoxin family protein [Alteromonas halophila]GGW88541.1 hypothetical protein GCM10007391_23240 [Alteromonas halophila]
MKLYFYTGPNCSLCDLAIEELNLSACAEQVTIETRNIRNDHDWYHRYAVRIPVLQRADNGQELGWPFSAADIEEFVH